MTRQLEQSRSETVYCFRIRAPVSRLSGEALGCFPTRTASATDPARMQQVPFYRLPWVWLRLLYDWTMGWSESRFASLALSILAFCEASFFPIPPDVLLMALAISKPKRSLWYATVCTLGSVAGAVLGWYIGASLWASFGVHPQCAEYGGGAWLFEHVPSFHCDTFGKVQALYEKNVWVALLVAAFTPIPFKVFTLAAGVFHISLPVLLVASSIGRAGRFFLVAMLLFFFGKRVRAFIERHFEWMTLLFAALLLGGFYLIKKLH